MNRYSTEVREQTIGLLRECAGSTCASRISGVKKPTVDNWQRSENLQPVQMSEVYPRITLFSEKRLREAAERTMDVDEAAKYAGTDKSLVKGFWRRINHNYITTEQADQIKYGISVGANEPQICRYVGDNFSVPDLEHYLKLENLELQPYNHSNPLSSGKKANLYSESVREQARGLAKEGLSGQEIERITGVPIHTIRRWCPHSFKRRVSESVQTSILESTVEYLSKVLTAIGQDHITDKQLLGRLGSRLRVAAERGFIEVEKTDGEWTYKLKQQQPDSEKES